MNIREENPNPQGPVPWDEIEPVILPTVKLLNDGGYTTFASCEGHGRRPWVRLNWDEPFILAEFLHEHGAEGFSIITHRQFISPRRVIRFLEVEFFGRDSLPKRAHQEEVEV